MIHFFINFYVFARNKYSSILFFFVFKPTKKKDNGHLCQVYDFYFLPRLKTYVIYIFHRKIFVSED
jgi:hypothetical protein